MNRIANLIKKNPYGTMVFIVLATLFAEPFFFGWGQSIQLFSVSVESFLFFGLWRKMWKGAFAVLAIGIFGLLFAGCKKELAKTDGTPISICARHPATISLHGPLYGDVTTVELMGGYACTEVVLKRQIPDDFDIRAMYVVQTSGTKLDQIDVMVGGRRKQAERIFLKDGRFEFRIVTTTPNSPPLFQVEQQ